MSGFASKENTILFGGDSVDISQFDFNDHSSRVSSVKTTNIALVVLLVTTVSLRLFAGIKFVHNIFTDDVLILLATVFTVALASTCIAATTVGLGQHIWLLPIATILQTMKNCILYLYVCQVLYCCAIALTKAAIISSYLRFIQHKRFHIAMYAISVVIAALWVTGITVTIFQCSPVAAAWDFTLPETKCINFVNYLYVSSAVNALTDILLCFLPIPHLWRLNMPRKQRVILCVLFAGGIGACVVGIVRIGFLHMLHDMDSTYQSVPSLNLSAAECSLGIICVSIPALRPIAQHLFPNGLRSTALASSNTHSQNIPLSNVPSKRNTTNTGPSESLESLTRDPA